MLPRETKGSTQPEESEEQAPFSGPRSHPRTGRIEARGRKQKHAGREKRKFPDKASITSTLNALYQLSLPHLMAK